MDIDVFAAKDLDTVFSVLRTALRHSGRLTPRERHFLAAYASISGYKLPVADPIALLAREVHIEGRHQRKRLIQLAALAALFNNPVAAGSAQFLKELCWQLGTRDPVVGVVGAFEKGRRFKARMLATRRVMRMMVKEQYLSGGARGVLRFFGALFFGVAVDKDKHRKYRKLSLLPEGTFGREYWKHMTEIGFGFPGEPGGIPDAAAFHDLGHVLAGNDTTPLGEIQQGSFQGGNRREDGFAFVQFAVLHFHHGIQVTPVAPAEVGNFDPELVLWAIHRGAKCTVDTTHQWDFWPLMSLSLEEARSRIGLLPKPASVSSEIRAARLEIAA